MKQSFPPLVLNPQEANLLEQYRQHFQKLRDENYMLALFQQEKEK